MYDIGDIVLFYSRISNKPKYHLCLIKPTDTEVGWFLLLNSEYRYNDSIGIDCTRIPELPPTESGLSHICCERFPYKKAHFLTHKPKRICQMATDICEELLEFVKNNHTVERRNRMKIGQALEEIIQGRQSGR